MLWSDLGNAYRVKGDADKAIDCFETALRIRQHPDFRLNLGGVRFALGELEEATRQFMLGLDENPRHVLLLFSLANALAVLGDKKGAVERLEATLHIQPDFQAAEQYLRGLRREMQESPWVSWRKWCAGFAFLVFLGAAQRMLQHWLLSSAAGGAGGADSPGGTAAAGGAAGGERGNGRRNNDVRQRRR